MNRNWEQISERNLWKELCFCILSANVNYELAISALQILWKNNFLDSEWLLSSSQTTAILQNELNCPQFYPRTKNGKTRKYRYPQKRSKALWDAARIIYSQGSLKKILLNSHDSLSTRKYLYDTIPGLGIKEASHFLRNIGYSNDLAIIDIHVLSFLAKMNLISNFEGVLTLRRYYVLEQILCDLTSFHNLELGLFDLAIWNYMRS